MNHHSLQALIIDHQFGELSSSEAESLEALFAEDVAAREEARQIHAALATTRQAVLMRPDLGQTSGTSCDMPTSAKSANWLALAAAVVFVAVVSGAVGFFTGRASSAASLATLEAPGEVGPPDKSPWTRYRIASNPGPGFQIVRLENHQATPYIK